MTGGDSQPTGYREDLPGAEVRPEEPTGFPPGLEILAGVLTRAGAEGLLRADSGTETVPGRLASVDRILATGNCPLPELVVRLPERVVRLVGASTLALDI